MMRMWVSMAAVFVVVVGSGLAAEENANMAVTANVNGYVQLDAGAYESDDLDLSNATELRRARLKLSGRAGRDWGYKLQIDLVEEGTEAIRDAYILYDGLENWELCIGQQPEPGSLEDLTSARYVTFIERGLPVLVFEPALRRMGLTLMTRGTGWTAAAGVFGEDIAAPEDKDDDWGVRARGTWAPIEADTQVLHLGASAAYRTRQEKTLRFRGRPEAHVDDTRLVDTGDIGGVDGYSTLGAELAWVSGPFSVQGEYLATAVSGEQSLWFDGYYAYASWFVTGEFRAYDPDYGIFTRVTPKAALGDGGHGAWEVGLRYSALSLNDGDVTGGEEDSWTVGVNWYPASHLRFSCNYVRAAVDGGPEGDVDADIVLMRAQVDF